MLKIDITNAMVANALYKARQMGELKNSITCGDGNLAGFLGEEIVADTLCGNIVNTYDYDVVTNDAIRYDVKTKRCTGKPKPHYECSIAAYNKSQVCNRYIFTRILYTGEPQPTTGWILGWMDKAEYFKKAKLLKEGEVDPSNNFTVKADCYNLTIQELNSVESLVDEFLSTIYLKDEIKLWWNKHNACLNAKPKDVFKSNPKRIFEMINKIRNFAGKI